MESNLRKFGEKFYDLNVSITGMCCLGLLDSSNRNAARALDAAEAERAGTMATNSI